jgi:hypothetical protein
VLAKNGMSTQIRRLFDTSPTCCRHVANIAS